MTLAQRLSSLEEDNRVLKMRFGVTPTTDLRHTVDAIQQHVDAQLRDPPETKANVEIRLDMFLKIITEMMNSKTSRSGDGWNRSVLESKGIQEVAMVENAKTYRQWNKKMKNALDLVRPRSREKLEVVEQLTEEQVIAATNELRNQGVAVHAKRQAIINLICSNPIYHNVDAEEISDELEELDRDMWSILMAKTTGEAEEKLEGCAQGDGLWGYLRIHLWFTKTTAQGKSMRRSAIMTPTRCKHEHEISAAIEKWEEKYRILKEEDKELELPDSWKMTAIQALLCGEIQKHIEYREQDFRTYDELRSVVMKWAINKKIEKERLTKGDPMDCSHLEGQQSKEAIKEVLEAAIMAAAETQESRH